MPEESVTPLAALSPADLEALTCAPATGSPFSLNTVTFNRKVPVRVACPGAIEATTRVSRQNSTRRQARGMPKYKTNLKELFGTPRQALFEGRLAISRHLGRGDSLNVTPTAFSESSRGAFRVKVRGHAPLSLNWSLKYLRYQNGCLNLKVMVGGTGLEPVTPTVSL